MGDDFSNIFNLQNPGTVVDMVPVPVELALVVYDPRQQGIDLSYKNSSPNPGTPQDMVPGSPDPAPVTYDTAQKEGDFSKEHINPQDPTANKAKTSETFSLVQEPTEWSELFSFLQGHAHKCRAGNSFHEAWEYSSGLLAKGGEWAWSPEHNKALRLLAYDEEPADGFDMVRDNHLHTWLVAQEDLHLEEKDVAQGGWYTVEKVWCPLPPLPTLSPMVEVPIKRRALEFPLEKVAFGVEDWNYFAPMNRTDPAAEKHLKEKSGVVRHIVFRRYSSVRMGKAKHGLKDPWPYDKTKNRHYRPENPKERDEDLLKDLRLLIKEIRWKTRGIVFSARSTTRSKLRGTPIVPSMAPELEVKVQTPEVAVEAPTPQVKEKTRRPGKNLARGRRRRGLLGPMPSPSPTLPKSRTPTSEEGSRGDSGSRETSPPVKKSRTELPDVGDQKGGSNKGTLQAPEVSQEMEVESCEYQPVFTLKIDWMNDSVTELRDSIVTECEYPGGPSHPPFVGGWYKVRVVAAVNNDDSSRTEGYLMLLKNQVRFLTEDSSRDNRINAYLLKACDGACLSWPVPATWTEGLVCTTGSAVNFDEGSASVTEPVLTVPYKSAIPEQIADLVMVEAHWWSSSRQHQQEAEAALARNETFEHASVPPYEAPGMHRLRVAGMSPWTNWIWLRKHGFQQPHRNARWHRFLMPPAEDGPGYESWMGAPPSYGSGGTGSFASDDARLLNMVCDFGDFPGHESDISGPYPALPSVVPSRPQGAAAGHGSQRPRVTASAPSTPGPSGTPAPPPVATRVEPKAVKKPAATPGPKS